MNQSIATGLIPPARGLEKEEPELSDEDDIPADDGTEWMPVASGESRPLRQVERE